MYDDLDPEFIPSPGGALPTVAERVRALRIRRRVAILGACGAVVLATVLGSVAFGSGGKGSHRLTVANQVTTTDGSPTTTAAPLSTEASSTTALPSTTIVAPVTTDTTPSTTIVVPPPTEPSTTVPPAHITVAFDRDQLVIKSGTTATISFTVSNDGDGPGDFAWPACPNDQLWPDNTSPTAPLMWPIPVTPRAYCLAADEITISAHEARTFHQTLVAGQREEHTSDVIPAPPGDTSYNVGNASLPVTITPPDAPPLTVVHPSEVTTASNAQHWVNFTIVNHLPFPVRYIDQGPCSTMDNATPCYATTPDNTVSMDMRLWPYATAVKPLYLTHYLLGTYETRTATAGVHGTVSLFDIDVGSPAIPPGIYHFDWDGQKVTFTVTP
jgi:hypothetical protein